MSNLLTQEMVDLRKRVKDLESLEFTGLDAATGSGVSARVAFWTGTQTLGSDAAFIWDTGNTRLGIGGNPATIFHIQHATTLNALLDYANSTAGNGPQLTMRRARGDLTTRLVVASGDLLARFAAQGYDGAAFQASARIDIAVDAAPSAGDMPSRMAFFTTPDASATAVEAMRINRLQYTAFGNAIDATRQVHVKGAGQTTAALTDSGNAAGTLYMQDSGGGAGNGGAILFGASQGHFAAIKALLVSGGTNTRGDLAFSTRNAVGDTALTERMRLNDNGSLWINRTSGGLASAGDVDAVGRGKFSKTDHVSGVGFDANYEQTTVQTTDTSDIGLSATWVLNASSASDQLVGRGMVVAASNNLTGGGGITFLRGISQISYFNASTTTGEFDAVYVEVAVEDGTVNTFRGVTVVNATGTNRAGLVSNVTGGTNYVQLLLADTTVPSGTYAIYSNTSDSSFFAGDISIIEESGATNTSLTILTLGHNSSGTPAASFGVTQLFQLDSSTTDNQSAANINVIWATATHASRAARLSINVFDTASRECIRAQASGTAAMVGFLGAAAVVRQAITGSRGGNAALASLLTGLANLGLITNSTTA